MVTVTPMLMCSPVASQLYNITVTCTIHPNSTADQCVVMAMADGRMTRTGAILIYMCIYQVLYFYIIDFSIQELICDQI